MALFSLAALALAFDRPLEAADRLAQVIGKVVKGADKFLLGRGKFAVKCFCPLKPPFLLTGSQTQTGNFA